jgi:hypothetical protein
MATATAFTRETKDCSAISDLELEEMAKLCAGSPAGFDLDLLTKAREEWVLFTCVRDNDKLVAFQFYTLERIGGTPCVILGIVHVKRNGKRDQVYKQLLIDQYHKMLMAFPDEDVVIATRMISPSGYTAFTNCDPASIRLQPGERTTGEERMWSKRLAKRFGADGRVDDQTFVLTGDGGACGIFDFEVAKPGKEEKYAEFFANVDRKRGDVLVGFGWMTVEKLLELNDKN